VGQARRAKAQPARVIIPLAVAAALLVGGLFAAVKFWPDATTAGPQVESSTTTVESQAPSIAESSPSQPPAAEPAGEEQKALEACQAKVRAADEVIKQGTTGVEHWAGHIQAQKDGNAGKITPEQMKAQFKATRVKGPGDLQRYDDARSTYQDLDGSCDEVAGGDSVVAAALADCNERSKAQKPLMAATNAAMKDWRTHLAFMQRNKLHKAGTPAQALQTWLSQYDAAPKNIRAFENASDDFDAPDC
jgi:hypothetical protein